MSISASLLAAGPIASGLFGLIDNLFTSDQERMQAKLKLLELEQAGELAQIKVNMKEAEHDSIFVAGWRPYIGWVCGLAFSWVFLFKPIAEFTLTAAGYGEVIRDVPEIDIGMMMPVLMGMLGLGAMRSYEKKNGVARSNLEGKTNGGVSRFANGG
jgi:hypothetical protein